MCVHVCSYQTQIDTKVKEQLVGISSLFLLGESLRSNSDPHTWQQTPSPAHILVSPSIPHLAFQDRNKEEMWGMAIH